jgi:prepilin-type N-terminal cleavage/methylation domain-containing protein/prepilin-type processing-associated H-X9-DG protein
MKKACPQHKPTAFTLLELLVSMAVLAILGAIVVTATSGVMQTARKTESMSNLRQIHGALMLYVQDNNGYLPRPSIDEGDDDAPIDPTTGRKITSDLLWSKALSPYLPTPDGDTLTARQGPIFVCPNADYGNLETSDIGSTYFCTAALFDFNSPTDGGSGRRGPARKLAAIEDLANTVFVSDGKRRGSGNSCQSNVSWNQLQPDLGADTPADTTYLDFRHNGNIHLLFGDGHIQTLPFAERGNITRSQWEGRFF